MVSLHRIFQQRTYEQDLNEFYSDDASSLGSANTEINLLLQSLHFMVKQLLLISTVSTQYIFGFSCSFSFCVVCFVLHLFSYLNYHWVLIALLPEAGCCLQLPFILFNFVFPMLLLECISCCYQKSADEANKLLPLNSKNGLKKGYP